MLTMPIRVYMYLLMQGEVWVRKKTQGDVYTNQSQGSHPRHKINKSSFRLQEGLLYVSVIYARRVLEKVLWVRKEIQWKGASWKSGRKLKC